MPLCRGWQTLSHIIVINLLTGGLIEGSRVGEAGVVVFVILYYSSFIFYFDVVCEIVLFWSHLKPLRREERKETVERSDDLSWTLTSPHWCQRSLCSLSAGHSTLKVQYTHTYTHMHIHTCIHCKVATLLRTYWPRCSTGKCSVTCHRSSTQIHRSVKQYEPFTMWDTLIKLNDSLKYTVDLNHSLWQCQNSLLQDCVTLHLCVFFNN